MSSRPSRGTARLAAILDALPDALLLVNCNGTVVNANTIALETFESPGTRLVGRGLLDLLPGFDSDRIPGSMRRPDAPEEGGRTKPTRMVARRTDGTDFPVEVTSSNLEDGHTPYPDLYDHHYTGDELLMLVVRDLTGTLDTEAELARQQRQTEMILRAAAEGVVGVDTDGRVVLVNPSAAQILGYRASDLGGEDLHALIHHSRPDGTPLPYEESPLADSLRSGRKHRVRGQALWAKDGRAVAVDLTTAPVRDGDQLVGAVMTFTDRRAYDALAGRHAQLLAVLGDSLRGPLEEMRGELSTLADDPGGQLWPEANQILHHLAAGYARMTTLVDNVLLYQRLDAGSERLERELVSLDGVVAAGVEGAIELIGPGRAQFAVHAPPIEAEVDPQRLAQALAHLIADVAGVDSTGNAPVGGGSGDSTIVVAAAQRGEVVRIEVRGPYAGGDPVHEPIVRGIVRRHGGVLQTHEVPGMSGSAYVLEVPMAGDGGPVGERQSEPQGERDSDNATAVMPVPKEPARGTAGVPGARSENDALARPGARDASGAPRTSGGGSGAGDGTSGGGFVPAQAAASQLPTGRRRTEGQGGVDEVPAGAGPSGWGLALAGEKSGMDAGTGAGARGVEAAAGHSGAKGTERSSDPGGSAGGGRVAAGHGRAVDTRGVDTRGTAGLSDGGSAPAGRARPALPPAGSAPGVTSPAAASLPMPSGNSTAGPPHQNAPSPVATANGALPPGTSDALPGGGSTASGSAQPTGRRRGRPSATEEQPRPPHGAPQGPPAAVRPDADADAVSRNGGARSGHRARHGGREQAEQPHGSLATARDEWQQRDEGSPGRALPPNQAGAAGALPAEDAAAGSVPQQSTGAEPHGPTGRRSRRIQPPSPGTGQAQSTGPGAATEHAYGDRAPAQRPAMPALPPARGDSSRQPTLPPAGPDPGFSGAGALSPVPQQPRAQSSSSGRRPRRPLADTGERQIPDQKQLGSGHRSPGNERSNGGRAAFALPPAAADQAPPGGGGAAGSAGPPPPAAPGAVPPPGAWPAPGQSPQGAPAQGFNEGGFPATQADPPSSGRRRAAQPGLAAENQPPATQQPVHPHTPTHTPTHGPTHGPASGPGVPQASANPGAQPSEEARAISVRTLGQGVPFAQQVAEQHQRRQQPPVPPNSSPGAGPDGGPPNTMASRQPGGPGNGQQGANADPRQHEPQSGQPTGQPTGQPAGQPSLGSGRRRRLAAPSHDDERTPPGGIEAGQRPHRLLDSTEGRSYAIGAPDAGAEGPEPLDGPNGAVDVTDSQTGPPMDAELPPEPLDNPRRLLVWPAPDASTQQALSDRGYRPVIVHSREEVDAQISAYPAALFVDPLTGPITRTALQSLRTAAVAAEVPVLVTAGLGQATRGAAYGADPAVLLKALAPRDSDVHPPRVLLIEPNDDIAGAMGATLERRGMQVGRATADEDAVTLASRMRPNLVVMDLMQVRRRRAGVLDWLRANGLLNRTPLVVYTSADIDPAELPRLRTGETVLFLAERSTGAEVQDRIVDLLAKISTN